MKIIHNKRWLTMLGITVGGLIALAVALNALSQTGPPISIMPLGTNQLLNHHSHQYWNNDL